MSSNIQAHSFIPKEYWMKYFWQVKEMLPDTTVYVYENQSALRFYFKEGFQIKKKQMDSETDQTEFTMEWSM